MTKHSGIAEKLFPNTKICWCCGREYDPLEDKCIRGYGRLGHPCHLFDGRCKTKSVELRMYGHCKGKVTNKSWGMKKSELEIVKFDSILDKLEYYDSELKELKLKKHAIMNSWSDEPIDLVISIRTDDLE